ncbi:MAG: M20/M25/M40 family metallo-hydrolase, partial [Actinomycetota bacterium]
MSDVATLLQELIRFDTTNPPGNEEACVAHIEGLLHAAGVETERYEQAPGRPNLVARHAGTRQQPPLLLYGHVDVVTTAGQSWTHPPFGGELHDGFIWGRGALDMK